MGKYFVSYAYSQNDGEAGHGNTILVDTHKEIDSVENIDELQDKIEKEYGFDAVVITNFIRIGVKDE